MDDKYSIQFIDTIQILIEELGLPKERIKDILYLEKFDLGDYSLSNKRIDFILSLISKRISLFKEML